MGRGLDSEDGEPRRTPFQADVARDFSIRCNNQRTLAKWHHADAGVAHIEKPFAIDQDRFDSIRQRDLRPPDGFILRDST